MKERNRDETSGDNCSPAVVSNVEKRKLQQAIEFLRANAHDRAEPLLQDLEATNKRLPEVLYGLGLIEYSRDRLSQAETYFWRAVGEDRGHANSFYYLGLLAKRGGKAEQARVHFEQVLALVPTHAGALTELQSGAQRATGSRTVPVVPVPMSDLSVPTSDEALTDYLQRRRRKERGEWWIVNWHRYPPVMKVIGVIFWAILLAGLVTFAAVAVGAWSFLF